MHIIFIFLAGAVILVGAIIVNAIGSVLGLPSWYTFLQNPKSASTIGLIWLFLLYPFLLGIIGYTAVKLLKL